MVILNSFHFRVFFVFPGLVVLFRCGLQFTKSGVEAFWFLF